MDSEEEREKGRQPEKDISRRETREADRERDRARRGCEEEGGRNDENGREFEGDNGDTGKDKAMEKVG